MQTHQPRSYGAVTGATQASSVTNPSLSWFQFKDIPLPPRQAAMINIIPAMEWDLATNQFEHALIMKFSTGKPTIP